MGRPFSRHRKLLLGTCVAWASLTGCGILTYQRTEFPDQLVGANGEDILLDDLNDILNDPNLDAEGKRQALRDLGIEDEDLLDAILAGTGGAT